MSIFFWKNNRQIDAFAGALAADLFSHVQPEAAKLHFSGVKQKNKKKQRQVEMRMTALVSQMKQFSDTYSLGVYGKARLQKKFSDRLLELGYEVTVANKLVESILLRNL